MTCQSMQPSDWSVKGSCFGGLSEAYAAARGGRPLPLLQKLSEYIQNGPLLDVGTGTGISAREIADLNPRLDIVGVDHDPTMLEKAHKAEESALGVLSSKRKPICYLSGKAEALPLPDSTQEVVTAMACFHWFDKDRALQEFYRVLKPKGYVAIVSGLGSSFSKKNRILEEVVGHTINHPLMGEENNSLFERNRFDVIFKGTFHNSEKGTVSWAVERVTSSSYWDDVKKAGKETEAREKLAEEFSKSADTKGMVTRESDLLLTIIQKR